MPVIEDLKVKAKKLGLWNLFLSKAHYPEHGVPLTNLEVSLRKRRFNVFRLLRTDHCSMLSWPKSWEGVDTLLKRRRTAQLPTRETWVCESHRSFIIELRGFNVNRGPCSLRIQGATEAVACPTLEWGDSVCILDDGTFWWDAPWSSVIFLILTVS